jgi:hypothetical protein
MSIIEENWCIIIPPNCSDIAAIAFADLAELPHVTLFSPEFIKLKYSWLEIIRNIHLCRWTNRISQLPYKYLWYDYGRIFKSKKKIHHILIFNNALWSIDSRTLSQFKDKFIGCKIDIFFWDSIRSQAHHWDLYERLQQEPLIDKIFTFDADDAKRYGFIYTGLCYYSKLQLPRQTTSCDLYFIAHIKQQRLPMLNECYEAIANKVCCNFQTDAVRGYIVPGIHILHERIPYKQVIQNVQRCNCIFEIVKENQTGPTLRYFEAICYNKKLLTNNPNIVHFPLYNARYMHIFNTPADIDTDWIKRQETVDYHYDGRFSPIHLLELIISVH